MPDVLQAYPQIIKINTEGDTLWISIGYEQKDAGSPLWIAELTNGNIVQSYEIYRFLDPVFWENDWYWYPTVLNWYSPTRKLIKSKTLITPGKHRLSFNQMKTGIHGDYFFAYGVYEDIVSDNFYGFLTKYDNEGDTIWSKKYQHVEYAGNSFNHYIADIVEMKNGNINLLIFIDAPGLETWLLTVDSDGCHENLPCTHVQTIVNVETVPQDRYINIYPNPVSKILYIDLRPIDDVMTYITYVIYDAKGMEIMKAPLSETQIDVSSLTTGIFFLELICSDSSTLRSKFVKFD